MPAEINAHELSLYLWTQSQRSRMLTNERRRIVLRTWTARIIRRHVHHSWWHRPKRVHIARIESIIKAYNKALHDFNRRNHFITTSLHTTFSKNVPPLCSLHLSQQKMMATTKYCCTYQLQATWRKALLHSQFQLALLGVITFVANLWLPLKIWKWRFTKAVERKKMLEKKLQHNQSLHSTT